MGFLWFQNGKPPIKITETTTEIEELRSRLEAEKKMRQDVEKELELQVDGAIYIYLFLYIYKIEKWILVIPYSLENLLLINFISEEGNDS